MKEHKLDNPAWHSLHETHANFSVAYNGIKFYHPDYCPFGGFTNQDLATTGISKYGQRVDNFFVIGKEPILDDSIQLKRKLTCNQMTLTNQIKVEVHEEIVALKSESQRQDLFNLVSLVQPGFFKKTNYPTFMFLSQIS